MKKTVTALLVLILLVAMTGASASQAGSAADPLITRSYVQGEYTQSVRDSLVTSANSRLQSVFDAAAAPLRTQMPSGVEATSGAEGFVLSAGGSVTVPTGGSFTTVSGKLTLTVSGEVVDVTSGSIVPSGTVLTAGHRYIVTEGSSAQLTAASASRLFFNGPYSPGAGLDRMYALYNDVAGDEWFADAARYAHDNRLFPDYQAAGFNPNGGGTRAEMVHALWVTAGSPFSDNAPGFTDLTEDWYVQAVNWAAGMGITTGTSATTFEPNGIVSRSQMAAFMFRYTACMGGQTDQRAELTSYSDYKDIADWAMESVSWATAVGLIQGTGEHTMSPLMDSSRGQIATVIMRFAK